MRLLYAISISCLLVMLLIAVAIVRRFRLNTTGRAGQMAEEQPLTRHPLRTSLKAARAPEFFEAGEFRTPRPLALHQELHPEGLHRLPSAPSLSLVKPSTLSISADRLPQPTAGQRKPPQSFRPDTRKPFRRLDLSGYAKDIGDLTDPYTGALQPNQLRGSGTTGPVPKQN